VRKVTSEVSVSRRRRSLSARSALPPKASLAQLKNPRLLYDEPELEAAVSAWIEAESAREEASLAQEHVASLAEEVQQRRLEPGQVVRWRSFRPRRRPRPGQIPPKVETTLRVLLLPLLMSEPAGRVFL
jgi:hypothetical protein